MKTLLRTGIQYNLLGTCVSVAAIGLEGYFGFSVGAA